MRMNDRFRSMSIPITTCCARVGLLVFIRNVHLTTASSDLGLESSTMALTVHEGIKSFPVVIVDFFVEVYKQSTVTPLLVPQIDLLFHRARQARLASTTRLTAGSVLDKRVFSSSSTVTLLK